jgi:O-antigen/teichoic acid export membrane protein
MAVPGKAREIFSTTLIYSIGTLLTQFVSFLLLPIYTRYLTAADYGALSLVMVGQSLIVLATELGIVSGLFRFHHHFDSDEERSRLLGTVLYLLIGAGAAIVLGVQWFAPEIAGYAFSFEGGEDLLRVACMTGVSLPLVSLYLRTHQLAKRPWRFVGTSLCQFLINVTTTITLVVVMGMGVLGVLLGQLAAAGALALFCLIRRGHHLLSGFDTAKAGMLLRFSLPLLPTNIAAMVIALSDRFFLERLSSLDEVGRYAVADKMATVLMVLVAVPFSQSWAQFAYSAQKDASLPRAFARMFHVYAVAMTALAVLYAFAIRELLWIATTPEFASAYLVVPVLLTGPLLHGFTTILGTGIHLANRTAAIPLFWIIAMAVNLGLNAWLIPEHGMIGAATATAAAFATNAILYLIFSRRVFPVDYPLLRAASALLGGALTAGTWMVFDPEGTGASLALRAGLFLGLLAWLLVTGAVRPGEIADAWRGMKGWAEERFGTAR